MEENKNIIKSDLNNLYETLLERKSDLFSKADHIFNPREHKDKTRSKIALIFVCCFFALLIFTFIFVIIYNGWIIRNNILLDPLNPKDLLLVITGAIGTPLGFVVGYYFKGEEIA